MESCASSSEHGSHLTPVRLLGLGEGLDNELVMKDAVAILGAGKEDSSIRFTRRLCLVELEGKLDSVNAGHRQRCDADRRVVDAGA